MIKWVLLILLLLVSGIAVAQITGPIGGASGVFPAGPGTAITGAATGPGDLPPPPTCSDSFDFSDGCNSQYLGGI